MIAGLGGALLAHANNVISPDDFGFLLAVFTRRCNAIGALVGLLTGAAVTMAVAFGTDINFLLYAAIGSCSCFVVGYLVSLITGGQDRGLAGLTLATLRDVRNDAG